MIAADGRLRRGDVRIDVRVLRVHDTGERGDQQATLAAFKGPALVLMGVGDRLCPRDRHQLMHDLMPQSRFAVIADAGHLPTLEQPAPTAAELIHWLNQPL